MDEVRLVPVRLIKYCLVITDDRTIVPRHPELMGAGHAPDIQKDERWRV